LKKKALILTLTDFISDPRPRRNFGVLKKNGYDVEIASYFFNNNSQYNLDHEIIYKKNKFNRIVFLIITLINNFLKFKCVDKYVLNFEFHFKNKLFFDDYDLIFVEDLKLIPIIFSLKCETKILFDAREYYPRQFENSFIFRIIESKYNYRLCKTYLKKVNYTITVSETIKQEYEKNFDINVGLIMSTPNYFDGKVGVTNFSKVKIVHHGMANRNRKIENMIKAFRKFNKNFYFDLFLVGDKDYISELKKMSASDKRIQIKEPVKHSELLKKLSNYDIGFFYVEPTTFNLKYCLPNKFFEYIQARLAIIIGPSIEMARLVDKFNVGHYSSKFDVNEIVDIVNKIKKDQINLFKKNSHNAASILCFENESKKLKKIIENIK